MTKDPEDKSFAIIVADRESIGQSRVFVHSHECPRMHQLPNGPVEYKARLDETTGRLFATWIGKASNATRRRNKYVKSPEEPPTPLGPNVDWTDNSIFVTVTTTRGEERRIRFNRTTRLSIIMYEYSRIYGTNEPLTYLNKTLDPNSTAEEMEMHSGYSLFEGVISWTSEAREKYWKHVRNYEAELLSDEENGEKKNEQTTGNNRNTESKNPFFGKGAVVSSMEEDDLLSNPHYSCNGPRCRHCGEGRKDAWPTTSVTCTLCSGHICHNQICPCWCQNLRKQYYETAGSGWRSDETPQQKQQQQLDVASSSANSLPPLDDVDEEQPVPPQEAEQSSDDDEERPHYSCKGPNCRHCGSLRDVTFWPLSSEPCPTCCGRECGNQICPCKWQTWLRSELITARDNMRQAMITLGVTCRLYGQFGKKDGLDIIKEDINFELFNENHKTWWTEDSENNEA